MEKSGVIDEKSLRTWNSDDVLFSKQQNSSRVFAAAVLLFFECRVFIRTYSVSSQIRP